MKRLELAGQKFGRLTVVALDRIDERSQTVWRCVCQCGNEKLIAGYHLKRGDSNSCGCLSAEITSKRSIKHGYFGTRLYRIWFNMKQRCKNEKHVAYERYGGRGIHVCTEWQAFIPFQEWALSHGYRDYLSIDRIDNDKGYSPENCRWATCKEQQNNRRPRRIKV